MKIPCNKSRGTIITSTLGEKKKEQQRSLLSYIYLKYIIVISNIVNLVYVNFCEISFNRALTIHFHENSWKIATRVPPSNLCSRKLYEYHLIYIIQNFVRFYAIECEVGKSKNFWKNGKAAPLLSYIYLNRIIFYHFQ